MNVTLTAWHESETCTWCEKSKECVTADFGDGLIKGAPLCFRCLQRAIKVHARQQTNSALPAAPKQPITTNTKSDQ